MTRDPADVAEILADLSDEQAIDIVHRLFLWNAAAEPLGEMEPDESVG